MATPEKTKQMNAAARKWDELWETVKGMQDPERVYILSRITSDLTVLKPVDSEASE